MHSVKLIKPNFIGFLTVLVISISSWSSAYAQPCSVLTPPSYSSSCTNDYFTAMSASGTGVTSSVSYSYSSCVGTYYNYYSSRGITAPTGNTVNMVVTRNASSYNGYISIFVDWNNDNSYASTESVGTFTYTPGVSTHTFSFTVPTSGIVTATNLHMRVMLSEVSTGAPCTATWGESVDYYFNATCGSPASVSVSPSSGTYCSGSGSGVSFTASVGGGGGTYTWTPSSGLSATTGATVVATPTTTTTYSVTGTNSSGCSATATVAVTVNPAPSAISGTASVCVGGTTTLTDAGGGTWSSGSTGIATIGSTTGVVTGVASGTSVITYTLPTGCYATAVLTVNPLPSSISGTLSACVGATTTLSDAGGGTWSSGSTGIATIGSSTGVVTGVAPGTATITYTLPTGCTTTAVVTVNPSASAISGVLSVCPGSTTTLTGPSGGTWTSSSTAIATVGSATGIVTGVSAGTATVTCTVATGCFSTAVVTVNPLPSGITGVTGVCVGATTTLSCAGGGTWSSGTTSVATVGSGTGIVTGVSSGVSAITYTLPTGCTTTIGVIVSALPSAISGTLSTCPGSTTTLTDAGGGTWSSGSTGIATVGSSTGIVTGVISGTATITYTLSSGCYTTAVVTVNALPSPITGFTSVCVGSTTTLTDAGGGTWSSGATGVATVGSASGIVTGVTTGTATISYTLSTGCAATIVVTVSPLPSAISGVLTVCAGATTTLTDAGGGTWSAGSTGIATVGSSSGIVTGVSGGTSDITYTLSTGCYTISVVTVNPLPSGITGIASVCVGLTTTLTDAGGGAWTSGATGIATVGSGSGVVTGVSSGTATITYTLPTGCTTTIVITVNPLPASVTGTMSVCVGSTTTLSGAGGGTWSSGSIGVATVGSGTGIVTGVAAGTVTITYTISTGCFTTTVVTVNPLPVAITGTTAVCVGSSTTLTDGGGGTWSSGSTGVATVGSGTGVVTGITAGTATITYTLPSGCSTTTVVTVNALPSAIGGTLSVCVGLTTTLTDAGGGTWTSGSTGIATIGSTTGVVTGVTSGTATITYTLGTGCITTSIVTVNPLPSAIGGVLSVCVGSTTTLTDAGGGTWTSSATGIATIGSGTGIVTGITSGNTTITYRLPTGCIITAVVTVNPLPSPITGVPDVCVGATTTLSGTGGGTWSSGSTGIATVGSGTGVVTGVSAGTAVISYTISTGCTITTIVTVEPLPSAIGGVMSVCVGATTTLTDAGGGTWSSSATSVATVVSGTGVVTGVSAGTAVITYTLPTGCVRTATVTVNPLPYSTGGTSMVCPGSTVGYTGSPSGGTWSTTSTGIISVGSSSGLVTGIATGAANLTYTLSTGCSIWLPITVTTNPVAISGTMTVCAGSTTTLIDLTAGGTWSTSATGIATVGSASGVVTGVSGGLATITYTVTGTGCFATAVVTVNPLPAAISGLSSVCIGGMSTLTSTSGGAWASGSTGVVTIGSSTGVFTGVSSGTATITYTLPTGCFTTSSVTVNLTPAPITGSGSVCAGGTTVLTDAGGGVWSSGSTGIATVGSTGIVTGVSVGTATITYSLGSGCSATMVVTVYPSPSPITGADSVCVGGITVLSDASGAGTWTSGATGIATVGPSTGVVTGIAGGTAGITFTVATGCTATAIVTVNPLPSAISGASAVCLGSSTTLSNGLPGGTWTSGATAIVTINPSTGLVSAVSVGTATITYTLPTGCAVSTAMTVEPLPSPISGASSLCVGSTTSLSDLSPGGSWSSSSPGTATIGSASGIVSGISAGVVTITYTLGTGCYITSSVTVNPLPAPITGSTTICIGTTSTLSDATTGGLWASSNTAVAAIGSTSGVLSAIAAGSAIISYTLSTGCRTATTVTVIPVPAPISGIMTVCTGATTTLTGSGGGAWISGAVSIATVGSATGVVSGISAGTAAITYAFGTGCIAVSVVTVNTAPSPIAGSTVVCVGATSTLTDGVAGGAWTSSNPAVAPVGASSGIVTGLSAGTSVISYTLSSGCRTTASVTVISAPSPVTGIIPICTGGTMTLIGAGGGTWSSGSTGIATIGSGTGIVTGVSVGAAVITYTLGSGCSTTATVTVGPLPPAISGPSQVCIGGTITLTDAGGGSWTSASTGIAAVGAGSGIVTGISAGTSVITYSLGGGCIATSTITVNPLPAPITGVMGICISATTTLGGPTGGSWTSGATSIATITPATGIVTGIAAGNAPITYTLPTGCIRTATVTVNPFPAAITGTLTVCVGATTGLVDAGGGLWSSASTGIATVGSATGVVTGVSAGPVTISYSLGTGCTATAVVTVNPLPSAITGIASVCVGSTTTLSDLTAGGTWTSAAAGIATVGSASGVVSGLTPGIATIIYRVGTGCAVSRPVTVNPLPGVILGSGAACFGLTTVLTASIPGGTWSSANTAIAAVGSSTGVVTGVAVGVTTISYAVGTGCPVTRVITVNALPPAISGSLSLCQGSAGVLTNSVAGGTWTSSNTGIATVNPATGAVTGISPGLDTITYTLPTGCQVTATITVNPGPAAIAGTSPVCVGAASAFSDPTPGGAWSSSTTTVATISSSGLLSGIASGTTIVSYTAATGCSAVLSVIIDPISPILGTAVICAGQTTNLHDTTLGGSWSSGNPSVAMVNLAGVVTGVSAGTAVITYSLPSACMAFRTVTVNPLPAPIAGITHACAGQSSTLSDPTPAGLWSGSNPGVALVSSAGVVYGVSAGTVTITYAVLGCVQTTSFTVNPLPAPITGASQVCIGSSASLSDLSAGGSWSSSSPVATIGSASGIVTGISAGTATITYTLPTACLATVVFTVNPLPAPITGIMSVCIGANTSLSNSAGGGSWTSSNTAVATINPVSGIVTGVSAGTAVITYTLGTGCFVTATVTVNTLPPAITGPGNVCLGSTITLSDFATGGAWSSSTPSVATVGTSSGVVTGIAPGVTVIGYSLGTGCSTSVAIVVHSLPSPISGTNHICAGATTSLYSATSGGTWASGNTSIATVDSVSGLVTGSSAGVVTISYTAGCSTSYQLTVNALPSAIAGPANVCLNGNIVLHDGVGGGAWTSANLGVATIDSSSGVVTGMSIGSTTIFYTLPGNCATSTVINVIPLPATFNVTGGGSRCSGDTGIHIGLSGSALMVNYFVYRGSTAVGAYSGTGAAMDFGLFTVGGTYTVVGASVATGCRILMTGSATISVTPSVTPSVTFSYAPGDTVCAGTSVTFNAIAVNGGTPAYVWSINSHPVATTSSYAYIPANGDTVQLAMRSTVTCASPSAVTRSHVMTVRPFVIPTITLAASPGDTVCTGSSVTVNTVPLNGGTAPFYSWFKNGVPLTGVGSSFTFIPNNGDVVYCVMNSNYACRLGSADTSNALTLSVDTAVYPFVSIAANPGTVVGQGQPDTLTAVVANPVNPSYQWFVNGVPATGATSSRFVSTSFSYPMQDSISVIVTNNGVCTMSSHQWVYIRVHAVGISQVASGSDIRVVPNPNKGDFIIEGTLGSLADEEIALELTDMIGQVAYNTTVTARQGKLDAHIFAGKTLANGMYMLTLKSVSWNRVFHMVIEQ